MKLKYKILIILTPAVFVADQLSKLAVERWMPLGQRIPIIPGLFDLVHYRNTGAAFGIFSGMADSIRVPFFYIVAIVALVLLALFYRSLRDRDVLLSVALSLIFGGIAGNIADRIRLGSVIDFLSFHIGDSVVNTNILGKHIYFPLEWPAFNIADSAITIAMALLFYSVLLGRKGVNE